MATESLPPCHGATSNRPPPLCSQWKRTRGSAEWKQFPRSFVLFIYLVLCSLIYSIRKWKCKLRSTSLCRMRVESSRHSKGRKLVTNEFIFRSLDFTIPFFPLIELGSASEFYIESVEGYGQLGHLNLATPEESISRVNPSLF